MTFLRRPEDVLKTSVLLGWYRIWWLCRAILVAPNHVDIILTKIYFFIFIVKEDSYTINLLFRRCQVPNLYQLITTQLFLNLPNYRTLISKFSQQHSSK